MYTTTLLPIHKFSGQYDENNVYIGRKGYGLEGTLGNPVKRGSKCPQCGEIHETNGSTLKCYELYLRERLANDIEFKKLVTGLVNKTLICFCKDANKCHGTVLIKHCHLLNNK